MDPCPPGSSVHGILQARILEWVAVPFSRGSSWPRNPICVSYVSCTGRWVLYHWHYLLTQFDGYTSIFVLNKLMALILLGKRGQKEDANSGTSWCSDIDTGTVAGDFLKSLCHVLAGGSSHEQGRLTLANLAELDVLKDNGRVSFFFYGWIIFLYVYTSHFL